MGSYLLDALPAEFAEYIRFHLETVGCRYCAANLDDLRESQQPSTEAAQRRQKFFQSSAGYVRKLDRPQ